MIRPRSGPLVATALASGFLATLSLALPWFTISGRSRSSVDLLSSASALDVIDGWVKVAVIGGWLLAPIIVSAAMLVAASGRHRRAAMMLVPVALVTLAVVVIGATNDRIQLAWGAGFGGVFAALASACAIMVLVTRRNPA